MEIEHAPVVARYARLARPVIAFALGVVVAASTLVSLNLIHDGTLRSGPAGGAALSAMMPIPGILGALLAGVAALGSLIWATSPPGERSTARSFGWALAVVVFTVALQLYLNPGLTGSTGTAWPTIWVSATGLLWAVSSVLATSTRTRAAVGMIATLVLGLVWPWLYFLVYLVVLVVRGDPIFEF